MSQVAIPPAAVVGGASRLLTVDDLLAMPDEGWGYELVDGVLVERNKGFHSMGADAARVESRVNYRLMSYTEPRRLGHVFGSSATYECFGSEAIGRRGDVSFVQAARMPTVPSGAIQIPADLIVEVISPTDVAYDVNAKVRLYLRHGFGVVWVVWPEDEAVDIHAAGQRMRRAAGDDAVDAEPAVPGFSCPASALFRA